MKRRVIAALLTLTMVFSLTACGGSKSDSSKDSSKKEEKEATVDTVKDPITISFWHDRTSDTDYAWLKESIDEFNKTNEYGITVEEVGQGYLDDVQAALTTAIAAGDSPVLADLSCNGIPLFASEGVLADMTPYIERDNFDMDNVVLYVPVRPLPQSLSTGFCTRKRGRNLSASLIGRENLTCNFL